MFSIVIYGIYSLPVYVRLSVDEIEHHGHEHIVASVYINKVHFEKRFCGMYNITALNPTLVYYCLYK